jgi:DNA-3-methyladenine glycosylase I
MTDYKAIFEAIEHSLLKNSVNPAELKLGLDSFKEFENKVSTDEEFYEITQIVVFASGIKASTMHKYHPGVRKHLPSIEVAAACTPEDIIRITQSKDVIALQDKVEACVNNARAIQRIVKEFGSTHAYIQSFAPFDQFRNVTRLRNDIMQRFDRIASVTSFHLMTDLGLPVLKPDRVIMRIFQRLGLLQDESELFRAVELGQEFARATGYPIRYIDIVFVTYGQVEAWNDKGICLDKNPKCHLCEAQPFCQYYAEHPVR